MKTGYSPHATSLSNKFHRNLILILFVVGFPNTRFLEMRLTPTSAVLLGPTPPSWIKEEHRVTDSSRFPYFVRIVRKETWRMTCGGTIISPTQILTAAHCLYHNRSLSHPQSFAIVAGCIGPVWESDPEDDLFSTCQIRYVSRFLPHEGFDYFRNLRVNDIAVIHLSQPLRMTETVTPVRLPDKQFMPQGNGTLIGNGCTALTECRNEYIYHIEMPILRNQNCTGPGTEDMLTIFCTKSHLVGGCYGDSGGPLICRDPNNDQVLCGVLSAGGKKCDSSIPDLYANVASFLPLITDIAIFKRHRELNIEPTITPTIYYCAFLFLRLLVVLGISLCLQFQKLFPLNRVQSNGLLYVTSIIFFIVAGHFSYYEFKKEFSYLPEVRFSTFISSVFTFS